jgi:hypothetical protein
MRLFQAWQAGSRRKCYPSTDLVNFDPVNRERSARVEWLVKCLVTLCPTQTTVTRDHLDRKKGVTVASKARALLLIWPSWLLVSCGIFFIVFKIGDSLVKRPIALGGTILVMMTCSLIGAIVLWIVFFGFKYTGGRIRSRYGHKSQAAPPDQASTDKF